MIQIGQIHASTCYCSTSMVVRFQEHEHGLFYYDV